MISPATARFDRHEKLPIYARAGVEHVWIADPGKRTLEVLHRQEHGWRLIASHSGNATISEPPFEQVAIELAPLWS